MSSQEHCGFIGLIGRPNVGKSTLLNKLLGQDLSITTPKPQTTRNRLIGIRTQGASQMVFIDTPGIHESNLPLNRKMIDYAVKTLEETDLNLWLVEPLKPHLKEPHPDDKKILDLIRNSKNKTILVINKMDLADRARVLRTIDVFSQNGSFAEIIPLSALKSTNLESLLEQLEQYLPEHPFFFEIDQLTDASERFLVAELVREQIFRKLQQELPYSTAVQVERFHEDPNCLRLDCLVCVERESQKGILIGKGGTMLKQIGTAAREKIEKLLGQRVFLALHVKVVKQWTRKTHHLQALGYH
ncbi:MAG: GTPase Era [SAR324 cluster bacterium]|nr:GTPase Era [SAR324 cluster bacterium]